VAFPEEAGVLAAEEQAEAGNGTQMNADYQDFKHKELTERIIKAFYRVYNKLGYGFLEIEVGLLLNFGAKPEVRRKAFDNIRK
jgi:hypothetical protein